MRVFLILFVVSVGGLCTAAVFDRVYWSPVILDRPGQLVELTLDCTTNRMSAAFSILYGQNPPTVNRHWTIADKVLTAEYDVAAASTYRTDASGVRSFVGRRNLFMATPWSVAASVVVIFVLFLFVDYFRSRRERRRRGREAVSANLVTPPSQS